MNVGRSPADHGQRSGVIVTAAVIGTGMIGRLHVQSLRRAGGQLAGVGAGSPDSARRAAAELGVSRVYGSPEEVAADPDVDVVHVCSPNDSHLAYAAAALKAGKHVVCEKPLGTDLQQATDLAGLAERTGLVATVPFVYRFYPTVREARHRVASGALGDVRLVHGSYLQDWLSGASDWNWRVSATTGGRSRAFADIGSHWCDLAEFLTGDRIVSLHALLDSWHDRPGPAPADLQPTEDTAVLAFRTERGASGSVVVSQVSPGRKNRLWIELDGTTGSAVFDQENPETLWLGGRGSTTVLHRGEPASPPAEAVNRLPPGHPQGFADSFALFVEHTYAAIGGAAPDGLPTFADGLRSATLVDAVLRSAATGAPVSVPLPVTLAGAVPA